ncbi:Uncharacterised protein [Kingella potus]|uniref:Uncharacterized protein n=1 Tax=Kingella potus TaxID=265175 RepID=A0A377QZX9_9NEIS|nr:Uncharacterised protein [Kingella potus]
MKAKNKIFNWDKAKTQYRYIKGGDLFCYRIAEFCQFSVCQTARCRTVADTSGQQKPRTLSWDGIPYVC